MRCKKPIRNISLRAEQWAGGRGRDPFGVHNAQIINSPLASIHKLTSLPVPPIVSCQYNNFYRNDPRAWPFQPTREWEAAQFIVGFGRHCYERNQFQFHRFPLCIKRMLPMFTKCLRNVTVPFLIQQRLYYEMTFLFYDKFTSVTFYNDLTA